MFHRTMLCALLLIAVTRGVHAQQYYGSKWGADGLANTVVGGSGAVQGDYRFRSTHAGKLGMCGHSLFALQDTAQAPAAPIASIWKPTMDRRITFHRERC